MRALGRRGRGTERELEERLREHYRAFAPEGGPPEELLAAVDRAVATRRPQVGWPTLLASQARLVLPRCAPAAAIGIAIVALLELAGASRAETLVAASAAGALQALAALSGVVSGRAHGMTELEAACLLNARSVACARLLLSGCVCAVTLALCAAASPPTLPAWVMAARLGAPYLIACAGGLAAARRAASADSLVAALVWAGVTCAASALVYSVTPAVYARASDGLWAGAAIAALLWCAREVALWLRAASLSFEPAAPLADAS